MTEGVPMLFVPPMPPIHLRPHVTVVMGRSRSCDLRLPSTDASRRHAEIVTDGDGFLLRDLGSTNGTFVNGERVEERSLRPGDRIQIGADTILFCHVDSAHTDGPPNECDEAETLMVERPIGAETGTGTGTSAGGEMFQGDLAEIPPFAVLQILEMGRKTGVLQIDDPKRGKGRVWFADGAPVHAESDHQDGFDAALDLVCAEAGRFTFQPEAPPEKTTISASVTELLLEASRLLDERAD